MTGSFYEQPLPALELNIDGISIETAVHHQGSFTIKNTGGGLLSGDILSRNRALNFSPTRWTGNSQAVTYTYSPEDTGMPGYDSIVYIRSNGGEIALPVTINPAAMTIPTEEGPPIATISDFYNYALQHPAAARRLFTSSEFYMLLLSTGYKYMDIYESLHKDVNRERAMDNFFVVSGLKGKTQLSMEKQSLNITLKSTGKIYERFQVQKSDGGYADAPVTAIGAAPWLTLSTGRLSSSDFDKNNLATVNLSIDPLLISGMFAREHILVGPTPGTGNVLELTFRRAAPLNLRINKEGFRYEDRGSIEVENNTGTNMKIDVYSRDRYVRFYTHTHMASAVHSIPFEIRPSAFASAQRLFSRLPYISTYIDVRAHAPGQVFHKRLHLNIGEW